VETEWGCTGERSWALRCAVQGGGDRQGPVVDKKPDRRKEKRRGKREMQVAVSQDVLYKMQGHVEAEAALPHAVDGCRHRLQPIPHVHPTLSRRCSVLRRIDSAGAEVSQNWRRHGPKRWSLCPGPGQAIRWKIPQVPQSRLTQVRRTASPTGIPPFAVGRAISVCGGRVCRAVAG
jgi:hypothetical protein